MNAVYIAIFFTSAAILAFQVTLTRFFALAQGHHFAFMAISLALLGAGASGTYLSLRQPGQTTWQRTLKSGTLLFTVSLPAAYLATNYLPFDAYRLAWEPVQLLWLALYYLSLTIPFFFGGLVIGAALSVQTEQAGLIYAVNLLGSGLGPPVALLALATVGGPGAVIMCTLLGWLAALALQLPSVQPETPAKPRLKIAGYGLVALALIFLTFRPPAIFEVRLTPYKTLSQALLYPGSRLISSQWNAASRVDVLQSEGIRSAPGLSFTYSGQLPPQLALIIDGDNLTPITTPDDPAFTRYLPLALAFELRPQANVLILEPGGGLAVLTATARNIPSVTVVYSNPTALAAARRFGGQLYNDPRVTVIVDNPRSFLRRTGQQFDLIILPLADSFHPVTAGAYTLTEDYRYTVESFSDMLDHLTPAGLLVVERWLQLPPSESLRLWAAIIEALRQRDPQLNPAAQAMALRSLQTSLVVAGRSPLPPDDVALTRQFATRLQFDPIWLPDIQPEEVNRYSFVPNAPYYRAFARLLTDPNPATFYAQYAYAVTPPTDDHPFFFHFFKWRQTAEILQALGKTWQPFGGSGYLVLVILLALVVSLSAFLILAPLFWLKAESSLTQNGSNRPVDTGPHPALRLKLRYLFYFALLGLGFLFVEIPLLQRFILYLGQPTYSFTVVVSAILVAAGVGSGYLSARLSLRLALPLIVLLTIAYPFLLPLLFDATLRLPFAGRIAVTVAALFPLGALLGIPFPRGLSLVGATRPKLVPWVWGVNGCASVVSAVLAAMISLTWNFSTVLWGAALAYALAAVAIWALLPHKGHKPHPAPVTP